MPTVDEVLNSGTPGVKGTLPSAPVPLFIIIGADKGGTGKTTITRALDDFLAKNRVDRAVFDSQYPKGDLRRFVPSAEVVNLMDVDDQMRTFDTVKGVSVLDISAGLLSPTLADLKKVGLLDDVRSGSLRLALLHVLGQSVASMNEVAAMVEALGTGSHYYPIKNMVDEYGFQEWERDPRFREQLELAAPFTITVPHLASRAATEVQKVGESFERFGHDPANSRMLRGYVRDWLASVHSEFDRVGLGKLIRGAV